MPESHAGVQRLPEPDEDRQLDQGRNAAADRIDAVLLVQRERLLGLLLLVVLVFLLNLLEVRLKLLGPLGHEGLLAAERKHHELDQKGQQDDRDSPVAAVVAEESGNPSVTWYVNDKVGVITYRAI